MTKDVIISVKATQRKGASKDKIELITKGVYKIVDGVYQISYDETAMTGLGETSTTLCIQDDTATLIRNGDVNSEFTFKHGEKYFCHYDNGIMIMNMGITTRNMKFDLNDVGGTVYIKYDIDINNSYIGENSLEISLGEAKRIQ